MRLTVRAPATVANLGSGFDCLALALDLTSEFVIETAAEPGVAVQGEGAEELPADGTNLTFRTISYLGQQAGGKLPVFRLTCTNAIPLQRGLGSSAAAVVAGLMLADRLLGANLSDGELLNMAVDLEGHPDNVSACLHGGVSLAYLSGTGWKAEALQPDPRLRPTILVPDAERVSTVEARRMIPRSIPLADATFNLARSALAVVALTSRPDLLPEALQDRLHQSYRFSLMPSTRALFEELRSAGMAVCVAGSGPSLLVFEDEGKPLRELGPGWRVVRRDVAREGATLVEG
jgi:homoserine kinase